LVYPFNSGWSELDIPRPGIKEAFEELAGKSGYERQQAKIADTFQSMTNEMIEYLSELGSK
jgi:hypothetical protein